MPSNEEVAREIDNILCKHFKDVQWVEKYPLLGKLLKIYFTDALKQAREPLEARITSLEAELSRAYVKGCNSRESEIAQLKEKMKSLKKYMVHFPPPKLTSVCNSFDEYGNCVNCVCGLTALLNQGEK